MRHLLGILNFFLLQWIFIRLAIEVDTDTDEVSGFYILYNVYPLTGWWSSYNTNYKSAKTWNC